MYRIVGDLNFDYFVYVIKLVYTLHGVLML